MAKLIEPVIEMAADFTPLKQAAIAGILLDTAGVSLDTYRVFMDKLSETNKGELIARCEEEEAASG